MTEFVLQCENRSLGRMNDLPTEAWKYFPAVALPGMITVPQHALLARGARPSLRRAAMVPGGGRVRMCPAGLVCAALFKAAATGLASPAAQLPISAGSIRETSTSTPVLSRGGAFQMLPAGPGAAHHPGVERPRVCRGLSCGCNFPETGI